MVQRGTRTAFIPVMQMFMLLLLSSSILAQFNTNKEPSVGLIGGLLKAIMKTIQHRQVDDGKPKGVNEGVNRQNREIHHIPRGPPGQLHG
ncbi:uncharacterized protein [Antennarius striatus]|uniref:uncharacterized protein isoform X4 n=1 Tax=Antennarius striatus TaxID=241820 RepID=UPI0035B3E58F